jgi:molybdopterin/thiamine biosynthesis adenylyltransferase
VLSREGQQRLRNSAVFVARVGGMGGPAAMMLAMAGIGRLVLAHGGSLLTPDLNRQVLGSEEALGKPRAAEFAARLRALNRFASIEMVDHEPDDGEACLLAGRVDLVVSSAPTFAERLRLNQAAVAAGVPLVDAAQWGMTGTLVVVQPRRTACLRCLYPEPPPFEELFPVVGAISCALGSLAALEAIKILSGDGKPAWGRMLTYDGFQARFTSVQLARDPNCPSCATSGS